MDMFPARGRATWRSSPTSTQPSGVAGVLERIHELGIELVYCGGDLVGYGPHPNEVCALIQERAIPTIYGNYDYAIAREEEDCGCAYVTPHDRELGQQSVAWTLEHTDRGSKDSCWSSRSTCASTSAACRCTSFTGRRAKSTSTCSRTSRRGCMSAWRRPSKRRVLVFGHTHKPWVHEYGGVLFVNCGSVGKPKDGDPRGAFTVLSGRRRRRGDDRTRRLRRRCGRGEVRRAACPASTPTSSSWRHTAHATPSLRRRLLAELLGSASWARS